MTLKPVFAALFTAGILSGCTNDVNEVQSSQVLVPIAGERVPAGVPCDHLMSGATASVGGCEGYIKLSPLSSEQSAEIASLNTKFATEVPPVVNFDFDRADLRPDAKRIIDAQAAWMRRYTHIRFSVYGHTDLVGSEGYNFALAKRRAETVVAELASQGVSQDQLDALVSYGKTRPIVATTKREELNRRTVTEVTGYLTGPRLRTKEPVSCSVIAQAYLASYPSCVRSPSAPMPHVAPPPPQPVNLETSAKTGIGTQETGTSASMSNDGTTTTTDTAGYAGGGAVSTGVHTSTTGNTRTVDVSVNGVTEHYSTNADGSNPQKLP